MLCRFHPSWRLSFNRILLWFRAILLFLVQRGKHLYKWRFPFSVNVPQKNNFYSVFRVSPVSISEKHNQFTTIFLPKSPILEWHIMLPFQSILFLYFWNVLKNLQEIKTKQNTIESSWQRSTELLLEKQLLLALSLSEGCGRRGQNTENMGLAVRTPRLRDQVGHLQVTWPRANRVPSWASGCLSVKIPALPPLEESWDS